jgi:hypothetical protein
LVDGNHWMVGEGVSVRVGEDVASGVTGRPAQEVKRIPQMTRKRSRFRGEKIVSFIR